jgi:hypothetical protein
MQVQVPQDAEFGPVMNLLVDLVEHQRVHVAIALPVPGFSRDPGTGGTSPRGWASR